MVLLKKERSRKLIIDNGIAYPREERHDKKQHFGLVVQEPWIPGGKHAVFTVILTKPEMLKVVSGWLELLERTERENP